MSLQALAGLNYFNHNETHTTILTDLRLGAEGRDVPLRQHLLQPHLRLLQLLHDAHRALEHHHAALLPLLEGEGRLLPLRRDLAQLPLDLALLVRRVAHVLDLLLVLQQAPAQDVTEGRGRGELVRDCQDLRVLPRQLLRVLLRLHGTSPGGDRAGGSGLARRRGGGGLGTGSGTSRSSARGGGGGGGSVEGVGGGDAAEGGHLLPVPLLDGLLGELLRVRVCG